MAKYYQFASDKSTLYTRYGRPYKCDIWRAAGCGIERIHMNTTDEQIRSAVLQVIGDPEFRRADISIERTDEMVIAYTTSGKRGCILRWMPW
tara:strand:- start:6698 stop:6973 length:276 start_codon:yes stop_codon:yes gene_type:complete